MSEREGEQIMQLYLVQLAFVKYIKDLCNDTSQDASKYTDKYINDRLMEVYKPIAETFFSNKDKLKMVNLQET